MSNINLTPDVIIPEIALRAALSNIIESLGQVLKEETLEVTNSWAEAAGLPEANIFMRDKVAEILAAEIGGFFAKAAPRPHQLTAEHVDAYMAPLLPPPSNNTPDPVK